MDDFLGTSIQYSEYQIKLLEKEHYENQQKIVEELISSGFLDSDYEDTTETESTDNESEASLEIKENTLIQSESPLIESVDDSKLNISPTSLRDDSSTSIEQELSSSPSSIINEDNEDLGLVQGSDISVVDESNVSNSESIDDASINNQIIMNQSQQYRQYRYRQYNDNDNYNDNEYKVQEYEDENENHYDSDDQIQEIQQFDIVTSKAIIRFMEVIFSDIKYLMILFILMIAMPHIIERAHIENDNDMQQFYGGGIRYQSNGYHDHGQHGGCRQAHYQTEIHWTLDTATTTQPIINDEDDERDEYQNDDDMDQTKKQCVNTPHILRLDIMTTKLDTETRELRGHLLHREFKLNCNNNMNLKMRVRNIPNTIPTEMPGLFMKIGAGIKGGPQMMRIFKETSVITSVGRHFTRSHGIYALVMAFVGIAGFAASNGIDEIITISS